MKMLRKDPISCTIERILEKTIPGNLSRISLILNMLLLNSISPIQRNPPLLIIFRPYKSMNETHGCTMNMLIQLEKDFYYLWTNNYNLIPLFPWTPPILILSLWIIDSLNRYHILFLHPLNTYRYMMLINKLSTLSVDLT